MEAKRWFTSKTEIANGLVILGAVLNYFFGIEIDTELQAAFALVIFAGMNMVLRKFTNTAITK